MTKVGDTVRYLNAVGGGKITRIEGKIAYVDDDGFENPVLLSEVVVVMPAGHEPKVKGAELMFDQQAFDCGRRPSPEPQQPQPAAAIPESEELPVEETSHGEKLSLSLVFEPDDIKNLSKTRFNAVLVNDSNYFLDFTALRRGGEERGWTLLYRGTVAPNELIDIKSFTHENLSEIERISIQAVLYKKDKDFTIKPPVSVRKRLDLTKFFKLHCFRPGVYFDTPVLEIPLVKDDRTDEPAEENQTQVLASKYRLESGRGPRKDAPKKNRSKNPADNPHKLLPPIEVDLHIGELLDSTAGMKNADMLQVQLDEVRKTMKRHCRRIGQKIIFIHGKGEGVLRNAVLALLRKEYPKAELQDASFQEYGFGATLVTIH